MDYQIRIVETKGQKLYVDPQEEEGFYLYPGEIRKIGLEDGMLLGQEEFWSIHKEYAIPRAKKRALGILSKKDMTQKELIEKLESSLNDSESIRTAMIFVTEHGYVDDESYARDYLYFRKGRKSFRQIGEELLRKGIDRDLLQRIFEEEGEQDLEEIRPLVEKYARKFQELDRTASQKICMHFARKGYPLESIRRVIEDMRQEREFLQD